jgi:dinuclear metal center YbgI/SA1388 family protein
MIKIGDLINFLETIAPVSLQESYDNAGLITGAPETPCTGALVTLDVTDAVLDEAEARGCNLVIAHHPLLFRSIKKLSGTDPVSRNLVRAVKKDIALYAIHTNLDNVPEGVNGKMASLLGLREPSILQPAIDKLKKLYCFVPLDHLENVRNALSKAGCGQIGRYSDCSFFVAGTGTFKAGAGADPFVGRIGELHREAEYRLEMIFPGWLEKQVVRAMVEAHPYEEVAYDIVSLDNRWEGAGSGLVGVLPEPVPEPVFLTRLQQVFGIPAIRHSSLVNRPVNRVALCGGAGSFLISSAIAAGADIFLTADLKYHDFFEADGRIVLADIGHFESEQFTSDLLVDLLNEKFPNFAVLKTGVRTNPVNYFL